MSFFDELKNLWPNMSDDDLEKGVEEVKKEHPDLSDDQLLSAAGTLRNEVDDGSFSKKEAGRQALAKYGKGGSAYSDEERMNLVKEDQSAAAPWLAGLAGFGAGLRGGDVGSAFNTAYGASTSKTKQALSEFDKMKANYEAKQQLAEKMDKEKEELDYRRGRDAESDKKQQEETDYRRGRDTKSDADRADETSYRRGRDSKSDARENEDWEYKIKERNSAAAVQARENDINSEESKLARSLASKMVPGADFSKLNASQITSKLPNLQKIYDIEQKKIDRSLDREFRKEAMAVAKAQKSEMANQVKSEKQQIALEGNIQKLSKDIAGVQGMVNALDEVESELGSPLDNFTTSGGVLKKDGKAVDLPGVSVPGYGRVSVHSDKAQRLEGAASKVFNTVLKDRSGAAVSNSELERLKIEFGEGKFNTEPQLIDALQRYKRGVAKELQNREAGYSPETVSTYSERGGTTSKTKQAKTEVKRQKSPSTGKTKIIYSDGSEEIL